MKISQLPYKVPRNRGANVVAANPQRLESKDGSRWACGRNVKRSIGPGRYDAVESWTLKTRDPITGKVVIVDTFRNRATAEKFIA